MPRSFKISFPLPRRPSASPNTTPGSQYSTNSTRDDSPWSHPGSKAERTLGASEPERMELRKKQTRKEKKQLHKYPSFMSVTLSEVDGDSVQASDGFPFPGMHTPKDPPGQPTQCPSRQGSSPLLGELYMNGSASGDNITTKTAPQAHRTGSSSTLRSHYDPAKLPLPVSQQTSASSARDMALRKGFRPISSPLVSQAVGNNSKTDGMRLHARNPSGESKASASSKLSGNSIKRINSIPRRRPSHTDPPTLYPHQTRTSHAVSPPPALINSSLPKTLPPIDLQTKQKWWKRKPSSPKNSPLLPIEYTEKTETFEERFPSIKVNVKKPGAGANGSRNWFDGVEDEDQPLGDLQHPEPLQQPIHGKLEPPLIIYEIMSQEGGQPQITQRKSSFNSKKGSTCSSERKLSFRLDSAPQKSHNPSSSTPHRHANTPNSPESKSIQSPTSSKGLRAGMDLQTESFLELSSSEDEGGEGSAPSEAQEPFRRHRIRASIERASYNSDVSVSSAQCAQPARPRSIVNRNSSRPLSKRSVSSEVVPPVPRIPDKPKLNQRTSSMRWREMMDEKAVSTESTIDSGASSLTDNANARSSQSLRTKRKPSIGGSKLMKVTSEEEKLLEAMRDKRASIRQDDFEKGFKTAMQLQDIVARPKTAGADGRTSRTSMYGSRSSSSPVPQEYGFKRSIAGSHLSAATDDLALEDSYPFPDVPSRGGVSIGEWVPPALKGPVGFVSPPKASPSLSFGLSDVPPSTPTSHNSPLTPPPGHGSLGGYGRNNNLSPPRGTSVMNRLGHDRKRTVSSSVVMLDGIEHRAQELDEDNELREYMSQW